VRHKSWASCITRLDDLSLSFCHKRLKASQGLHATLFQKVGQRELERRLLELGDWYLRRAVGEIADKGTFASQHLGRWRRYLESFEDDRGCLSTTVEQISKWDFLVWMLMGRNHTWHCIER
jgi:hypothetical protein